MLVQAAVQLFLNLLQRLYRFDLEIVNLEMTAE